MRKGPKSTFDEDVQDSCVASAEEYDLEKVFRLLANGYMVDDSAQLEDWLRHYISLERADAPSVFVFNDSGVVHFRKDDVGTVHETIQFSGQPGQEKATRIRTVTGLQRRVNEHQKRGLRVLGIEEAKRLWWRDVKLNKGSANDAPDTESAVKIIPEEFLVKLRKFDPKLKRNRRWEVHVKDAVAVIRWGAEGTTQEQERRMVFTEGKQKRTPHEQALQESVSRAKRYVRRGYSVEHVSHDFDPALSTSQSHDLPPLPCLAYNHNFSTGSLDSDVPVFVQPKLDGLRCIADLCTGNLWSRTRKPYDLPLISQRLKGTRVRENGLRWVDGELYRHGVGIQQLNSMIRNNQSSNSAKDNVEFHAFDVVLNTPFSERLVALNNWFDGLHHSGTEGSELIRRVETLRSEASSIETLHEDFVDKGYEGIMIRPVNDTAYESGKRTKNLLKMKRFLTEEYDLVDILPQRFANNGSVVTASVTVRTQDGQTFQATPKCSLEEKREMWENREDYSSGQWKAIIAYTELTTRGVPRFPVLLGFRNKDDLDSS